MAVPLLVLFAQDIASFVGNSDSEPSLAPLYTAGTPTGYDEVVIHPEIVGWNRRHTFVIRSILGPRWSSVPNIVQHSISTNVIVNAQKWFNWSLIWLIESQCRFPLSFVLNPTANRFSTKKFLSPLWKFFSTWFRIGGDLLIRWLPSFASSAFVNNCFA